jgi:hypothetical protein
MPEWWTYALSDFLLFSPRTYYRLIERHNLAIWPAQLLALTLGVAIAGLLHRPTRGRSRGIAGILAALWAWVGWTFVAGRYATINWAASYFAWLFAAEVLLLGWLGVATARLRFGPGGRRALRRIGCSLSGARAGPGSRLDPVGALRGRTRSDRAGNAGAPADGRELAPPAAGAAGSAAGLVPPGRGDSPGDGITGDLDRAAGRGAGAGDLAR